MHEVGEESRQRSYATMILTVDATLNMYVRRAGNAGIRDCLKTGACSRGSCLLHAALEQFLSRTPRNRVNLLTNSTIFYSKKRNIREINISWSAGFIQSAICELKKNRLCKICDWMNYLMNYFDPWNNREY